MKLYILEDDECATTFDILLAKEGGKHTIQKSTNIANALNDIYVTEECSPDKIDAYIFDLQIPDTKGLPKEYLERITKKGEYSGLILVEYLKEKLDIDIADKIIFCTGYYYDLKKQIGDTAFSKLRVVNKSSVNSLGEIRDYLNEIFK
ncbi:MAG: hypothetical protein LBM93_08040 [Oscillospiraceae bacterium]|jgi:hypothetical protein|nr:hypothetical protein [Oscillospiraceae bacterium]